MNLFEKLIKDKTPFAVLKYNEWLVRGKDNIESRYELITVDFTYSKPVLIDGKRVRFSQNNLKEKLLTELQLKQFKNIQHKTEKVISTNYGAVWEFNDFKEYFKRFNIKI